MKRVAFITGISGQDGSYLAELLLSKGYEVHGLLRRSSTFNTQRLQHLYQEPQDPRRALFLHYGSITDSVRLAHLLTTIRPDEIYNLAAQSHVMVSFEEPMETSQVTGLAPLAILDAIRNLGLDARYYQASSSEMFGSAPHPQGENSNFRPLSPYGTAKLHAHWLTKNYRESYGIYAVSGILFNHESPRRGETFVTRKVTRAVAEILSGKRNRLYMGELSPQRDWGYAPDYVVAMWRMLQREEPKDYVVGTGVSATVREFVEEAFTYVGLDFREFVELDEKYVRPSEVNHLEADAQASATELGLEGLLRWKELARLMTQADIEKSGNPTFVDQPSSPVWMNEMGQI